MTACAPPPGTREEIVVSSAHTGQDYTVVVFTPDALVDVAGAPVAYVFDGPTNEAAILAAWSAASDAGALPARLVLVPGSNRYEDYTPTPDANGLGGGLPAFLGFLTEELAPRVEADGAGGAPEARVVVGHSLGGLLTASLWYDHGFATRAGMLSPSLWWDGGAFFEKLDAPPVNAGPVVLACGEEETLGMVPATELVADTLRDAHGVDVTFEVVPDHDHVTVIGPAVQRSFEVLLR